MKISKQYLMYHFKWQLGFFVVFPCNAVLLHEGVPLWLTVILSGFVGACVFWFVDKWIFSRKW